MGIDIDTTVGVGFKLPADEALDFFGDGLEDASMWELIDVYLEDHPLLNVAIGGNSMSGEEEYVISVLRLEQSWNQSDYRGGLYGLDRPVLTLEEQIQLTDVAAELLGREPKIGQFVAVHIY